MRMAKDDRLTITREPAEARCEIARQLGKLKGML